MYSVLPAFLDENLSDKVTLDHLASVGKRDAVSAATCLSTRDQVVASRLSAGGEGPHCSQPSSASTCHSHRQRLKWDSPTRPT